VNIFGWRLKADPEKFRYKDVTLFIPRKNGKTWLAALILIILMLTEDEYSEFYSICLDRELATETKKAMTQIIEQSPAIKEHYKLSTTLNGKITCLPTKCYYQARTAEANKNNAIRPSAFIADEIGAFKNYSNITAMKSGQLNVKNPLMFKLTTAYAESESIMLQELEYLKKIYRGDIISERTFALLYYATEEHLWSDTGLSMANPLRIEDNYNEIRESREQAIHKPLQKTEFLTKHMNHFVNGITEKIYIDMDYWRKCRVDYIDLSGKEVVVGVDASLTTDLTAVNIMFLEDGIYHVIGHAFLPRDTLASRREDIDYELMQEQGHCTICDGAIVDYDLLEDYIRDIEERFNCTIESIVSDPYNMVQTMQRLSKDYDVIFIKQTYSSLSPYNKGFRQEVYKLNVRYQINPLMDWCMANSTIVEGRTSGDILLAKINKNRHRIDLTVASVFAFSELYVVVEETSVNDQVDRYMEMLERMA